MAESMSFAEMESLMAVEFFLLTTRLRFRSLLSFPIGGCAVKDRILERESELQRVKGAAAERRGDGIAPDIRQELGDRS